MAEDTSMQKGGAAASQTGLPGGVKVKKEYDGYYTDQHNHTFYIQFKGSDGTNYEINCLKSQTVLDAIRSCEKWETTWSDDKIVIQRGTGDGENIIATHFPCSCLKDDDILIVSPTLKAVEERQNDQEILYKDEYSVFCIEKEGGKYTKTKPLFKNSEVKQFRFLCVYGEKGITVQEALERDGRFAKLSKFKLSDYDDPKIIIQCTDKINRLHGRKFKIELPRGVWTKQAGASSARDQQKGVRDSTPEPSGDDTQTGLPSKLRDLVQRSRFRAEDFDLTDVIKQLRAQFPDLKKLMESRFPGNSFQEALNLKKENFGKIQKDFNEVHTLWKLLQMGESVCKVVVEGGLTGTGFVLIDNFIMTNAHLFGKLIDCNKPREGTVVNIFFNFKDLPPHTCCKFKVEESYICLMDDELDYAVLKVQPEGQMFGSAEQLKVPPEVPPGLLEHFGKMPVDGGACIIGYPGDGRKKIDLTCVIEPEKRDQAASDNLNQYKHPQLILYSLVNLIKGQGIDKIMMGGSKAGKVMTYNTFMYHGASGSPVFDAQGRVCGLHTRGYVYGFPKATQSVIEFAQSLEVIMKHLVETLTQGNDQELLGRIREVSKGNSFLRKILASVGGGGSNTAQQPDCGEPKAKMMKLE
ncbi:serine protease FAM111A-like [Halichoeres trimaculatus]|uniref:serine protease FAM111A-like n=1 Tax=Halichoeres trimaculatus TaxID=147232 RepID=UPI003D9F03ED